MRFFANIRRAGSLIGKIIGLYLCLVFVLSAGVGEIAYRSSFLLLEDAILFFLTVALLEDKKSYIQSLVFLMAVFCSVFFIRAMTPTEMKAFDIYMYFSFVFAVADFCIVIVATGSPGWKGRIAGFLSFLAFLPILLAWGFFFSEHAWLDVQAVMAVFQTNLQEAVSYIQDRGGWRDAFALLIYASLVLVASRTMKGLAIRRQKAGRVKTDLLILCLFVMLFLTHQNFLAEIASEACEYQTYYDDMAQKTEQRAESLQDLKSVTSESGSGVYVLVIGESETRDHMSAYGYEKETTPWLDSMQGKENYFQFRHAYSNYVETVQALSYALTQKNQYNGLELESAASILDVAKKAGYQTVWISNQEEYGMFDNPLSILSQAADQRIFINHHVNTLTTDYYDGKLIDQLKQLTFSDRMLIVVHLMGNHILYRERYPADYEIFQREGKKSEYDNSVLYNDSVMQEIVTEVQKIPNFQGLIYFSDHGEAIDRNAMHYAGTFGYDMARVPLYMIFSPTYMEKHPDKIKTLRQATGNYFTNDLIYNTLLGIMGIRDGEDEPENDLSNPAYNADIHRFKTLWGEKPIVDDPEFSK